MSLGLGHKYWVHILKHFYGTLEECIKHMQENKPSNKYQWYELRPDVIIKKEGSYNEYYFCDLVEEAL